MTSSIQQGVRKKKRKERKDPSLVQSKNIGTCMAIVVVLNAIFEIFMVPNSKLLASCYRQGRGHSAKHQLGRVWMVAIQCVGDILIPLWEDYFVIRISDNRAHD